MQESGVPHVTRATRENKTRPQQEQTSFHQTKLVFKLEEFVPSKTGSGKRVAVSVKKIQGTCLPLALEARAAFA